MVDSLLQPDDTISHDANYALNALRSLIAAPDATGSGAKLPPERDLTNRLGITRHALRQALDVLETEGLIWRRQGAGTFIGAPSGSAARPFALQDDIPSFDEVMEARLRIEPQLAQLAAMRATKADVARMRELNRRCIEAQDPESCELWDGAFHRQIAAAARNRMMLVMFDQLNRVREEPVWQTARDLARDELGATASVSRHHEAIITAIAEGEPLQAGSHMRDHLLDVQIRLQRRLTDTDLGVAAGASPSVQARGALS